MPVDIPAALVYFVCFPRSDLRPWVLGAEATKMFEGAVPLTLGQRLPARRVAVLGQGFRALFIDKHSSANVSSIRDSR